jgi:hypothetical protein
VLAEKIIEDAEGLNGAVAIKMEFGTDSDKCWFNARDKDESTGFGMNSNYFTMRSKKGDKAVVWQLEKEDLQIKQSTSTTTSATAVTTTTSTSSSGPSSEPSSEPAASLTSISSTAASSTSTSSTAASSTNTGNPTDLEKSNKEDEGDKDKGDKGKGDKDKGDGLSLGAKIGIIVACGLGLAGIASAVVAWWLVKRRGQTRPPASPLMRETELAGPGPGLGPMMMMMPTPTPSPGPGSDVKDPYFAAYYNQPTEGHILVGYGGPEPYKYDQSARPPPPPPPPMELPTRNSHMPYPAQELAG